MKFSATVLTGTTADAIASTKLTCLFPIRKGMETGYPALFWSARRGAFTTHDALTYSTKAATHKHVHPYFAIWYLDRGYGSDIPGRLIRHGAYFDFMMVWSREEPTEKEWSAMVTVLTAEVAASRTTEKIFTDNRLRTRKKFGLFHRQLAVGRNWGLAYATQIEPGLYAAGAKRGAKRGRS